jgi:hypothetical protein
LLVTARNPLHEPARLGLEWVLPTGWTVAADHEESPAADIVQPGEELQRSFVISIPENANPARRVRLAVDFSAGTLRLGQQAECLVDIGGPHA